MFTEKYVEVYQNKINSEKELDKILKSSKKIFNNCFDNDKKRLINKVGIMVGKVQSGKTSNYTSLIAEAFDNNVQIAVILAGVNSTLGEQNSSRLKEVFTDDIGVITWNLWGSGNKLTSTGVNIFFDGDDKKRLIIFALKNIKNLENLEEIFSTEENRSKQVIFIDDEADQYTLNSKKFKKKSEETKLHEKLANIIDNLRHYAYIHVTATPYANLFLDKEDSLYPTFAWVISPGDEYLGLFDMHGENSRDFIRIIEDSDYRDDEDNFTELPFDFSKALSAYLVASAFLDMDASINDKKTDMLVHMENKKIDHKLIKSLIDNQIKIYKEYIDYDTLPYSQLFEKFINLGFEDYFNRKIDLSNSRDYEIFEKTKKILNKITVIEFNRNNVKTGHPQTITPYNIYVGAALVERGITFNNLLITFITRIAKTGTNADTVLQRARWFGYRSEYKNLIRVFCSREIKEIFDEILLMEEDLWEQLYRASLNETNPDEIVDYLKLNSKNKLRPTRIGVANLNSNKITNHEYQKIVKHNEQEEYELYNNFLSIAKDDNYKNIKHKCIEFSSVSEFSKSFGSILNIILNNCEISSNQWDKIKQNHNDTKVKVIFMRPGQDNSERTVMKENRVQIFTGRAKKDSDINSDEIYKGDRYIDLYSKNKGKIIVEIFKFNTLKDEDGKKIFKDRIFYAILFPMHVSSMEIFERK